jgi:hypothetical protein
MFVEEREIEKLTDNEAKEKHIVNITSVIVEGLKLVSFNRPH